MRFDLIKATAIIALFLVSFGLYQRNLALNLHSPAFRIEADTSNISAPLKSALFESQLILEPTYLPSAHSSSLTRLPNGNLLAFWFAGTKEGRPDVKIWHSEYVNDHWSMATPLVDPQMIARANHRYVVKVGNPLIYRAKNGLLHLFVVSVSVGGWSGSALNHLVSEDNGRTWSKPERIVISPFFNVSTLVRTSAVTLADGGFYLPVYMELGRKYPELLRFDADGNFIEKIRITGHNKLIQPSLVPLNSHEAWVFFRNSSATGNDHALYAAQTFDGGKNWNAPKATNLTNQDASIVAANLLDGNLLMIYNPGTDRSKLALAISHDGLKWRQIYLLESTPGAEFSYPAMLVSPDFIDILYTNNRHNIKHVRFNREWLQKVIRNAAH
jgi:predicted neuraminidase